MMLDTNQLMDIPFKWGGRDPSVGLDCWGLVRYVLNLTGNTLVDDWFPEDKEEAVLEIERQKLNGSWIKGPRQLLSIVTLATNQDPHHLGLVIPEGVLHTTPKFGVLIQPEIAIKACGAKSITYYRHASWDK